MKKLDHLRIIGDCHGLIKIGRKRGYPPLGRTYLNIANGCEYSVQVGDMGFDYKDLVHLDHTKHVFLGGNHDNYDLYPTTPWALGDYGMKQIGCLNFFFVRGAFSIDKKGRIYNQWQSGHKTWWENEELSYGQGMYALKAYTDTKPDVMITHDCPESISNMVGDSGVLAAFGIPEDFVSTTQRLLQAMLEVHQPKYWFFGHYHKNWQKAVDMTLFTCINELSYVVWDDNKIVEIHK